MPQIGALALAFFALAAPTQAWSQAAKPSLVDKAYVAIFPGDSSDADFVVAFQHGIEVMLCQAGIKQRYEGSDNPAELKLTASLVKAEYWTDREARQVVRECALTNAAATLPGGASVELPDLAISGRMLPSRGVVDGRRAVESFFMACGASFARTALDAVRDKVALRGASCEAEPQPQPARGRKRKK